MIIKFGSKAKRCLENHYVNPISQSGTETFTKFIFFCEDCNKTRTEYWWRPKIIRYFSRLAFRLKCFIHRNDKDWVPF